MQSCIAALPSHMEAEAEADSRERGKAVTSRNWVRLVLVPSWSSMTCKACTVTFQLEANSPKPREVSGAERTVMEVHRHSGKTLRAG